MRRLMIFLFCLGLYGTDAAAAPDTLTLGYGSGCITVPTGTTTVVIPVHIRDVGGDGLGVDQIAGRKLQAFALQVTPSPASAIAKDAGGKLRVIGSRAGITSALQPLSETRGTTPTTAGYLLQFEEYDLIPFTLNGASPGDLVANLTVTLAPGLSSGTVINLTLDTDAAKTKLTNQAGTISEDVPAGTLALADGCIVIQ